MSVLKAPCAECGNEYRLTKDGMIWHHLGKEREGIFRKVCKGVGHAPKRNQLEPEDVFTAAITGIPGQDGWLNEISGSIYEKLAQILVGKGLTEDETIRILDNAYWAAVENYK